MIWQDHILGNLKVAEIHSADLFIASVEAGVDFVGELYFGGYEGVIIHQHHLSPAFFDLRNGMAGEILQKFSTYGIRLVIVGNWEEITSQALRDFIRESNRGRQVNFLGTVETSLQSFGK